MNAEIWLGEYLSPTRLHPSIAIATVNNGERHVLFVLGKVSIVKAAPDQALDGENRVFGVGHCLTFRRLTDETFIICERNNRRRRARAFGVFDHTGL